MALVKLGISVIDFLDCSAEPLKRTAGFFISTNYFILMPPIPVTFFIIVVLALFCLTIIVLKAKPKLNEVTSPKINIDVLFILSKSFVC
jgi:hypothetical protein